MTTPLQTYFDGLLSHGCEPTLVVDSAKMLPRSQSFTILSFSSNSNLRKIVLRTNSDSQTTRISKRNPTMIDSDKTSLINSTWDSTTMTSWTTSTADMEESPTDLSSNQGCQLQKENPKVSYGRKIVLSKAGIIATANLFALRNQKKGISQRPTTSEGGQESPTTTKKKHLPKQLPDKLLFSSTISIPLTIEIENPRTVVTSSRDRGGTSILATNHCFSSDASTNTTTLSQEWWNHLEGVLSEKVENESENA